VRNGNRWSVERTCPGGRADRVEFTVESPERLKGTITVAGPRPMAVQMTGQWVRAGCAGVK
jgi:hypothetical protein